MLVVWTRRSKWLGNRCWWRWITHFRVGVFEKSKPKRRHSLHKAVYCEWLATFAEEGNTESVRSCAGSDASTELKIIPDEMLSKTRLFADPSPALAKTDAVSHGSLSETNVKLQIGDEQLMGGLVNNSEEK